MTISQEDFDELCNIARLLNDEEVDTFEVWERLNEVIDNIEE